MTNYEEEIARLKETLGLVEGERDALKDRVSRLDADLFNAEATVKDLRREVERLNTSENYLKELSDQSSRIGVQLIWDIFDAIPGIVTCPSSGEPVLPWASTALGHVQRIVAENKRLKQEMDLEREGSSFVHGSPRHDDPRSGSGVIVVVDHPAEVRDLLSKAASICRSCESRRIQAEWERKK